MVDARAAVLLDAGADPELTDVRLRPPVDDEVMVRIDAVGICHTDISVRRLRRMLVGGHGRAGRQTGSADGKLVWQIPATLPEAIGGSYE